MVVLNFNRRVGWFGQRKFENVLPQFYCLKEVLICLLNKDILLHERARTAVSITEILAIALNHHLETENLVAVRSTRRCHLQESANELPQVH